MIFNKNINICLNANIVFDVNKNQIFPEIFTYELLKLGQRGYLLV